MVNIRNIRVSKYPNKERLMFVTGETFRDLVEEMLQEQFDVMCKRFGWKNEKI